VRLAFFPVQRREHLEDVRHQFLGEVGPGDEPWRQHVKGQLAGEAVRHEADEPGRRESGL
jgi:hypothetical protein